MALRKQLLCSQWHHLMSIVPRNISFTAINRLKEIKRTEKDGAIIVEGVHVKSPREKFLIQKQRGDGNYDGSCQECPICKLGISIKHTDVLILKQFINSKGRTLPRDVTGLCKRQHRTVDYLIIMAHKAGLMPEPGTELVGWEQNNKYYDESVIEEFLTSHKRNRA